ncbi:MAG TPA: DUF2474 domain-containing protein [Steroidobacteraceae bacterium]|jgi:hypothetical protein|nr:DUF2474 domain-containing protein [Steroidobacteraceae bacterium]
MASPVGSGQRLWVRRIGWFIVIWLVSVISLAVVAGLLRTLMNFAGLTR